MSKSYDRSAIMKAAWAEWRKAKAKGWHIGPDAMTFAACLRIAHAAAKHRQTHQPRRTPARDFLFLHAA